MHENLNCPQIILKTCTTIISFFFQHGNGSDQEHCQRGYNLIWAASKSVNIKNEKQIGEKNPKTNFNLKLT